MASSIHICESPITDTEFVWNCQNVCEEDVHLRIQSQWMETQCSCNLNPTAVMSATLKFPHPQLHMCQHLVYLAASCHESWIEFQMKFTCAVQPSCNDLPTCQCVERLKRKLGLIGEVVHLYIWSFRSNGFNLKYVDMRESWHKLSHTWLYIPQGVF